VTSNTVTAGTGLPNGSADGGAVYNLSYGGTTTGAYGEGATHTYPSGTTAYASAYHPPAPYYPPSAVYIYHPPTTVAVYGSSCYNCGSGSSTAGAVAAGVVVGAVVGASVASANSAAATSNAYAAGVATGSANSAAATSNAYNAGVAAGANGGAYAPMGSVVAVVPAGAMQTVVRGQTYYLQGNTWYQPAYGANGVYYRVVPAP
jgi:hypothetical protein